MNNILLNEKFFKWNGIYKTTAYTIEVKYKLHVEEYKDDTYTIYLEAETESGRYSYHDLGEFTKDELQNYNTIKEKIINELKSYSMYKPFANKLEEVLLK